MSRARGFTTVELVVVVAVLGVLLAGAALLVAGVRTPSLRAGAEELKALLNAARQLAVAENTLVCVAADGAGVRLLVGGCSGLAWTGPSSTSAGVIPLASDVRITAANPVVFTHLGAAAPAGSYTLADARGEAAVRVVVSASGRIAVVP